MDFPLLATTGWQYSGAAKAKKEVMEQAHTPGCCCDDKVKVWSSLLQVLQHGIFTHPTGP